MYYTVYQTTNLINNKIYVGVHKTNNLNDDYLGSGLAIKHAFKKYGKHNFHKEVLYLAENVNEMLKIESILVDKVFIERKDTYNLVTGGNSLIEFSKESKIKMSLAHKDKPLSKEHKQSLSTAGKGRIPSKEAKQNMSIGASNRTYTKEGKAKMKIAAKNRMTAKVKQKISISCSNRVKSEKCPHCNEFVSSQNASQNHFDMCKLNPNPSLESIQRKKNISKIRSEAAKNVPKKQCSICLKYFGASVIKRHVTSCARKQNEGR